MFYFSGTWVPPPISVRTVNEVGNEDESEGPKKCTSLISWKPERFGGIPFAIWSIKMFVWLSVLLTKDDLIVYFIQMQMHPSHQKTGGVSVLVGTVHDENLSATFKLQYLCWCWGQSSVRQDNVFVILLLYPIQLNYHNLVKVFCHPLKNKQRYISCRTFFLSKTDSSGKTL